MTETDTSRIAVERAARDVVNFSALNIRSRASDTLRALLARAEKAEAERDAGLLREKDANKRAMLHLRRTEKAEIAAKNYSEFNHEWRKLADTAWNDAIEAAVNAVNGCDRISEAQPAISALR